MWKWLFLVSYVWSGLFVGSIAHQIYKDKCFDSYYARSVGATVLWPLWSFVGKEHVTSSCKGKR